MTGRERVLKALTFDKPDRVPRDLWALPAVTLFQKDEYEEFLRCYPMDISPSQSSPGQNTEVTQATSRVGTYADEWGSIWHVGEPGVVGEVKKPALSDWSDLAAFQPPWEVLRQRDADLVARSYDLSDKFVISDCTARPFERLQFLRGTEALFVDLAYDSADLRKLIGMVHDFYIQDIEWWCRTPVDAILMMDDWGTNRSLLISPTMWRKIFKPLYREYCEKVHTAGKFAFFHSDGHIEAIYGDLIEVGMDAINSQLFVMDIEELARRYKGKVTFWGEIDRQHVLPFGNPDDVREAVGQVRKALDDGNGGVIAQCEWGKNNPTENIKAVYESWL